MDEQPFESMVPATDISAVPPSKKRSKFGRTVGALVLAGGVTAGGLALANQASADPSTTTSSAAATDSSTGSTTADSSSGSTSSTTGSTGAVQNGRGGPRGGGFDGVGQALHGEFVVNETTTAADGTTSTTTKTIRIQTGAVTAIDATSLTVLSTDSFSATYALGTGVDVTGIAVGDTVSVRADVNGTVVTAVRVHEKGTAPTGGTGGTGRHHGGRPGNDATAPSSSSGQSTAPSSTTAPSTATTS
jgi:hypothetical protein